MAKQVLTALNMNKNEIQNPVIHVLSTAPLSPVEGQIYYNSTDKCLYQYNGVALGWMPVGEDTNTTYTLDMSTVSAIDNSVGVTLFGSDSSQSTVRIGVDGGSSISKTTSTVGNKPMVVISSPTVDTSISSSSTNSNIPSSKAVYDYVGSAISASDAMIFKGTLGTGGTVTSLPTTYNTGWTYRVITAGTYAGKVCEIGDLIIALVDRSGSGNLDDDWTVAQTNIDGAITNLTGTSPIFVTGNGASRVIGISNATLSSSGAMSANDKQKLDLIGDQFMVYFYGMSTGEVQISHSYSEILSMINLGAEVHGVLLTKSYDDLTIGDTDSYLMCSPLLAAEDSDNILFSFRVEDGVILFDQDDGTIAGGGPGRFIITVGSSVDADDQLQTWDWIPDYAPEPATTSTLGVVKVPATSGLKVDANGALKSTLKMGLCDIQSNQTSVIEAFSATNYLVGYHASDSYGDEVILDVNQDYQAGLLTFSIASVYGYQIHISYVYYEP